MKTFKDYWCSLKASDKRDLAKAAATSYSTLNQVANGHRKAGADLSSRLKKADPNITDAMLRPDLYGDEVVHEKAASG